MSKYIIELDNDIKYLIINGRADNRCYTLVRPVAELELLNSDYINEHFADLQDTAYQKGFEDGKAVNDKGCEGCMWEDKDYNTCSICCNSYKNMYKAKKADEEIDEKITSFLDCNGYTIDEVFNRLKRMKGEE